LLLQIKQKRRKAPAGGAKTSAAKAAAIREAKARSSKK
jgi:hypothetical protein